MKPLTTLSCPKMQRKPITMSGTKIFSPQASDTLQAPLPWPACWLTSRCAGMVQLRGGADVPSRGPSSATVQLQRRGSALAEQALRFDSLFARELGNQELGIHRPEAQEALQTAGEQLSAAQQLMRCMTFPRRTIAKLKNLVLFCLPAGLDAAVALLSGASQECDC